MCRTGPQAIPACGPVPGKHARAGSLGDIAAWCGAAGPALPGLLLAGLAGGAMHCGPMCGGFVLGQVSDRLARLPGGAAVRVRPALLGAAAAVSPRAARPRTAALGALAATLGDAVGRQPWFGALSGLLLLAGALLSCTCRQPSVALAAGTDAENRVAAGTGVARFGAGIAGITTRIDRTHWSGGLLLGLALGFLPCGILYAALAVAAAAGTRRRAPPRCWLSVLDRADLVASALPVISGPSLARPTGCCGARGHAGQCRAVAAARVATLLTRSVDRATVTTFPSEHRPDWKTWRGRHYIRAKAFREIAGRPGRGDRPQGGSDRQTLQPRSAGRCL